MQRVSYHLSRCRVGHVDKLMSGKATRGYDPSQDIIWLRSEITQWIEGNLVEKWYGVTSGIVPHAKDERGSIKRRHIATSTFTYLPQAT